ncbi:MAG: amidohydrolase [Porticoccaceae bacterium]|nr:amidohydrolase [Porticoccaceae bacterium]
MNLSPKKWMSRLALLAAVIVIIAAFIMLYLSPEKPPASQAFINGEVITMDANSTIAQAVFVQENQIVAVGDNQQIESLISDNTLVYDLQGKTLVPGLIDSHSHFPGSGMSLFMADLRSPPVGPITNIPALLQRLQDKAKDTPKGEWVNGFGYDNLMLDENRHPSRDELDRALPDHPVFILHVSGHMGVTNSLGLIETNISEESRDPEGGHYARDKNGRLNGLLEEHAATPLQANMLDLGIIEFLRMVTYSNNDYLKTGVTTAQNGAVSLEMAQGLKIAKMLNLTPLRLELWPQFDNFGLGFLDGSIRAEDYSRDRLNIGAIKIIADGSIQGYTGYLSEPYHEPFHGDAEYRGYPRVAYPELAEWIKKYHSAGFQLAVHGNGDASIDDILDGFEQAQKAFPTEDPRLILIHAQMAREDQLARMKILGVTPSFFSAHTYYWGDMHRDVTMGEERANRISPARTAVENGLRFSSHLDTPIVPMSPLLSVWSVVNRLSATGKLIGADERIDVMQALRTVTIDAAWQIYREQDLGSIEAGKLADLVVLESSPLVDPLTIKDIKVERTIIGGVTVYQH